MSVLSAAWRPKAHRLDSRQSQPPDPGSAPPIVGEDGLPVPPPDLIDLVVGNRDVPIFVEAGRTVSHRCIVEGLARHGFDLHQFRTILDFGCGCGRVIRHWKDVSGSRLFGTDCNPILIEWCRQHLTFAEFQLNGLAPPLSYESDLFDFVFAGSVFTHMTEDLQFQWLAELRRVLSKRGLLMITVHGDTHAQHLRRRLAKKYASGKHVVVRADKVGTNLCGAYHPRRYIRDRLSAGFELLEHIQNGWDTQDMVILRKP